MIDFSLCKNWKNFIFKKKWLTNYVLATKNRIYFCKMAQVADAGFEPGPSVWQAEALSIIPMPLDVKCSRKLLI